MLAVAPMLVLTARRRPAQLATLAAAVVVTAWFVVTGLGTGFYFAAPAALLLLAALLTPALAPMGDGDKQWSTSPPT